LEIAPEDVPDGPRFVFDNGDLAIFGLIAQGHHAADPEALAFRSFNFIPDALGGDLPLELRKRQKNIQRQPTHRGRGVELLGDRDKGYAMGIEQFDQLGKVG
jgi:hypothetical protein